MSEDMNQDADEIARNQAALAAYGRQQESVRERYAAFQARQQNSRDNDGSPQGRDAGWPQPSKQFGLPPPQPQLEEAAGGLSPPAPPQFAVDTAAAMTAATQAFAAIAQSLTSRSANSSRGHDGEIIVVNDLSNVFDEVPENVLERVQYVQKVMNRLTTNEAARVLVFVSKAIV